MNSLIKLTKLLKIKSKDLKSRENEICRLESLYKI